MIKCIPFVLVIVLTYSPVSRASMFGEEDAILMQILQQTVQQLAALKEIIGTGQDALHLAQDINQGINDSLSLYKTVFPNSDPGIYSGWDKVQSALGQLSSIYGQAIPSTEFPIQNDTDQEVAEAITLNNSIYQYSSQIDDIGEEIKNYSHRASPGGAQKLTAETLGVMLHVMNESLRTQATGLKLSAQALALQNHKEKEETKNTLRTSNDLQAMMQDEKVEFALPRF